MENALIKCHYLFLKSTSVGGWRSIMTAAHTKTAMREKWSAFVQKWPRRALKDPLGWFGPFSVKAPHRQLFPLLSTSSVIRNP